MIDISSVKTPDSYEAAFGRIVPRKAKSPITIVCEMCGDEATVLRDGKRYCSARCRAAAHDAFTDPRLSRLNTVAEIAELFQVSTSTVRNLVRSGRLNAHRIGRMILIVRPLGTRVVPNMTMPPAVTENLRRFAETRYLSNRDFAGILGVSKTTAHRLLSGTLLMQSFTKRKAIIADRLTAYLIDRGEHDPASVVASLFKH